MMQTNYKHTACHKTTIFPSFKCSAEIKVEEKEGRNALVTELTG